jgi:hypothetical protein
MLTVSPVNGAVLRRVERSDGKRHFTVRGTREIRRSRIGVAGMFVAMESTKGDCDAKL